MLRRSGWDDLEWGQAQESVLVNRNYQAKGSRRVSAEHHYAEGAEHLEAGRTAQAEAAFRAALAEDETHANSWYQLGALEERRAHTESAAQYYRRALSYRPEHFGAQSRLRFIAATTAASGHSMALQPTKGRVSGRVQHLQQRYDRSRGGQQLVVTFRLLLSADQPPVPIEMRGSSLLGSFVNGDTIELPEGWETGRPVHHFTNLTTGEQVSMQGRRVGWARAVVLAGVMLVIVAFIAVWVTESAKSQQKQDEIRQVQCEVARKQGVQLPGC